jgi:hypothetical protein
MAYLLQAASLKYQEESPFSRTTTDNGRVIEQVCREWLCSPDLGEFVAQLAQGTSQQPPHMMVSQILTDALGGATVRGAVRCVARSA